MFDVTTSSSSNKTLLFMRSVFFFFFFFFFCFFSLIGQRQLAPDICSTFSFFFRNCQWNVLFSSPSLYRCCATLDWAQWALEQAQAGGRKKKPSSAQWKASVPLPQLNLRMNSLHCPSHGARRRITRVDSKQRGTVERAEPCTLHQL